MLPLVLAGAVAVIGAVTYYAFKPFVVPKLLDAVAWPSDPDIGQIRRAESPDALRPYYENKRVLVVGGTRGVGLGIAQACSRAGAHVTIVGRSQQSAQNALSLLGDKASFVRGDLGTVAAAKATVESIEEFVSQSQDGTEGKQSHKFDYLVVTAAIWPDWTKPHHQQEDGIDATFAVAVVGRYIMYKNMNKFLTPSARVLNVLGSGQAMKKIEIDTDLASGRRNPRRLIESMLNFACGNELVMQLIQSDPAQYGSYTTVSTHPGYIHTDLHSGQGPLVDLVSSLAVMAAGVSVEEAGLRQASILASPQLHESSLSFVSSDMKGRVPSNAFRISVKEYLPWLRDFLQKLQA